MRQAALLLYLTILHVLAIYLFGIGFLLTRISLDNVSEPDHDQPGATYDKAVILVIDALRYDFTTPQNGTSAYWNHLTILSEEARAHPENAFLTKFIADPPTTTLQRLKGLTTGSLPTFVDAGSNFAGDAIEEDNLLGQLSKAGKRIAFVGDDTWQALFPSAFLTDLNYPFESLNVWDLDTVDDGVYHHLFQAQDAFFGSTVQESWDVVIAHALGLDHAGHRYGPDHAEATRKLKQMDQWIRELIEVIDDQTLLIVMGDHGMNPQGDHGGDSREELEAALFMYSKNGRFTPATDPHSYDIGVAQIDLVSTFALLLGLPIPFNNLGKPIPWAFSDRAGLDFDLAMNFATKQIKQYIKLYQEHSSTMKKLLGTTKFSTDGSGTYAQTLEEWQEEVLRIFREQWAQYHMPSIVCGLTMMLCIILLELCLIVGFRHQQIVAMLSSFLPCVAFYILRANMPAYNAWMGIISPVLLNTLLFIARPSVPSRIISAEMQFRKPSLYTLLGIGVLSIHAAIFASNSFTIHEDRISLFFLTTLILVLLPRTLLIREVGRRSRETFIIVLLLAISRMAASIRLCREEQAGACVSNFSSTPPGVLIAVAATVAAILTRTFKESFLRVDSLHGRSGQWLIVACDCLLHGSWLYWLLDFGGYRELKLALGRIMLTMVVGLSIVWSSIPLPLGFELRSGQIVAKGSSNVIGSAYIQLMLPLITLCVVVSKSAGSIPVMFLIMQLLIITYAMSSRLRFLKNSRCFQVMVMLELASLYFFASGHQMALPFIQWDLAFFASKRIIYPLSPILVSTNAFASFIIVASWIPLLGNWLKIQGLCESERTRQDSEHANADSLQRNYLGLQIGYMTVLSVITVSTMLFATHFRRHLMVWKIFAPRFMCASLILLITDFTCIYANLGMHFSEAKLRALTRQLARPVKQESVKPGL